MSAHYPYKYDHLYRNNYAHLQPFYRKFYSEFQPKSQRPFKGTNQNIPSENQAIFSSEFECGNLDAAIRVTKGEYDIFMKIDSNTRGHMQWYYFKVKNVSLQKIKINIVNFRKKRTLYQKGMKPFMKVGSGDWTQANFPITFKQTILRYEFLKQDFTLQQITFKELSFQHKFSSANQQVEFAYCVPYPYSRVVKLLQDLTLNYKQSTILQQRTLCQSLSGIDIPILTITDNTIQNKHKKCIFVIGRQHPGESNGSFVAEGFLKWLCSDSPQAIRFRQITVVKMVPMINPDGVILGNFRTSLCGKDLNRLFKAKNSLMFPQVQAIKMQIVQTKKEFKNRFLMFLDFHGHSVRKNVFTYGPGFGLGEGNYYKSRIFPKIIANQTKMFRYYSCSFRISEHKLSTARAMISRFVPFCYTVETSNSAYYCADTRNIIDFTHYDWITIGKEIGVSSLFYIQMLIEEDRQLKQRLDKLKEKKQMKQQRDNRQKDEQEATIATSKRALVKATQTAKSIGNKRAVKDTLQLVTHQSTGTAQTSSSVPTTSRYSQNILIQQIKQFQEQPAEQQNDGGSDQYESGGSDSEGTDDDLADGELKKFHKGVSKMMVEFQSVFLKRNNSQIIVPKSVNTLVKKRKGTKQKKRRHASKVHNTNQQIHVMACLKSKVLPLKDLKEVEDKKLVNMQKFKSFRILQPICRMESIKQLAPIKSRQKNGFQQQFPPAPPAPIRNLKPRTIVPLQKIQRLDTLQKLDRVNCVNVKQQEQKGQQLQKIDQQSDSYNFSGRVSMQVKQFDQPDFKIKDRIQTRHPHQFPTKLTWLNVVPKRDRRAEYLQLARQRLQQYLTRQNVNSNYEKDFQAAKIRVRNISRTKQKQSHL